VIPAAGKGSRLGLNVPKILASLTSTLTVWDVLRDTLEPSIDHLHVVLSPSALPLFEAHLARTKKDPSRVSYSIQPEPLGMGDAVFRGLVQWQRFNDIFVIWGDQVFVSPTTVAQAIELQRRAPQPSLTLPLCRQVSPYVDYVLDERGHITRIVQSREGDMCRLQGFSDVGVFLLSTAGLAEKWYGYTAAAEKGPQTGELNFLPLLAYLSSVCLWNTQHFEVSDVRESRGINTPDDLAFFRQILAVREQESERDG
jgi:bifunctional UDP-N-acetylglucosamine pyrophosphorylase/glucosamine-1-phosphate N-acetyltransferase